MTRRLSCWILLALASPAFAADPPAAPPAPVGSRPPDFTLPDVSTGQPWASAELPRDAKGTVVAFLCTGCPVSNAYLPRLVSLAKRCASDNMPLVAVYSHPSDTRKDAAEHVAEYKLPFPAVHDADAAVARSFHVDRVPTVVVLDAGRRVRYFGRIDDQFAPGIHGAKATTRELANAIEAVIDGREVTQPFVAPAGCVLTALKPTPTATGTVTYHREISRLIQAKCQVCHRPGEAAPFALMNYAQAKSWSGMIREVVSDGIMPPWHADAPHGHFANDRRLSEAEKKTLLEWIDAGCPEGDVADTPPEVTYATGWRLGREPDLVVTMKKPVRVPAQFVMGLVGMPYQYIEGDTPFAEDTWVTGIEVRPDLRAAIHHIIVYTVPAGARLRDLVKDDGFSRHMLSAFVPGDEATLYPEGLAKKIPAGAKLLFEVHYTPNGKAGLDRSSVGLLTTKTPPKYEVKTDSSINPRLNIPPGAANHKVPGSALVFDKPVTVLSLTPHMHVRGKAYKFDLVRPDGTRETLLNVPNYDFNWQVAYVPATPVKLPAGSRLEGTAWYDNSAGNPANPDPTKRVRWGQQTWEEMMLGFVEYYEER